MLKHLVTIEEFIKNSTVLNPNNINMSLDLEQAWSNYSNLSLIDRNTIRLSQYLDQAGAQVNALTNGVLYNMGDYISNMLANGVTQQVDSNLIDFYTQQINMVKYVIIKGVEYFIFTNQIFADVNIEAPSNLNFRIDGQSDNSNVENKRLDLINILNTTIFIDKYSSYDSARYTQTNCLNDDSNAFADLDLGVFDNPQYKFKNGYIVKDVDYLGSENKEAITNLQTDNTQINEKIGTFNTQLGITNNTLNTVKQTTQTLQDKQDLIIGSFSGLSDDYIKFKKSTTDSIDSINTSLSNLFSGFQYKGEWNSTTTYSMGEVVSVENAFYYSKVDNNLGINPVNNPNYGVQPPKAFMDEVKNLINSSLAPINQTLEQNTQNISNLASTQQSQTQTLNAINNNYVTLNTTQTILNKKVFNDGYKISTQGMTIDFGNNAQGLCIQNQTTAYIPDILLISSNNQQTKLATQEGITNNYYDSNYIHSNYMTQEQINPLLDEKADKDQLHNYLNTNVADIPQTVASQVDFSQQPTFNGVTLATLNDIPTIPETGNWLSTTTNTPQNVVGSVNFNGGLQSDGVRVLTTNDQNNLESMIDGVNTTVSGKQNQIYCARIPINRFSTQWNQTAKLYGNLYFYDFSLKDFGATINSITGTVNNIYSIQIISNSSYTNSGTMFNVDGGAGTYDASSDNPIKFSEVAQSVHVVGFNYASTSTVGDDYNGILNRSFVYILYN